MYKSVLYILSAILASLLAGCKKDDGISPLQIESDRMVLVYIAANNDLQHDAVNSIIKMQNGFTENRGNKLLVYAKLGSGSSYLLDIRSSQSTRIVADTLKSYSVGNSADPLFLKMVIEDSRRVVKAKSYGLVMWSHATSWLPPASKIGMTTKSFGYDESVEMDIQDLDDALPDDLEYLLFDACSMGSIEVCFELKDKAKFILASPAEVLSSSFPYDEISNHLFEGLEGLELIGKKFLDYYRAQPGLYSSATISLINTKELDNIAQQTKALLSSRTAQMPFKRSSIQKLYFQPGAGVAAFDFLSFLRTNYDANAYRSLESSIDKAVVFRGATENFFGIPIKDFCGLSVYLPESDDPYEYYYSSLAWSQTSLWYSLFQ